MFKTIEHTYIIGQTGAGKSTLMKDMAVAAIHEGHGVFYMEPHGSDIDDLLPYIPYERRNDVVLFDPSDADFPIAWNPLEVDGYIALITSAFEGGIKDASGYSTLSTPTMSMYIRNSLYALIEAGEPLTGLSFMLTSQRYRDQVLKKVTDPLIKRFWQQFELLNTKDKRTEIASTYNKAHSLILDRRIRNILGQRKSAFQMANVLNGKILLARLPQGKLGLEQVRVLGHLLLSQFHLAALSRTDRAPVHVFLDEAHTFDGGTLCEMLSGIRKYGVSITLAHQTLEQISKRLRSAILGNVREKYVFRVSMADSKELNEHLGPDNVNTELFKLPPYTARRFFGETREDIEVSFSWSPDQRLPELIHSNMKRNYARPEPKVREEIDRFISEA